MAKEVRESSIVQRGERTVSERTHGVQLQPISPMDDTEEVTLIQSEEDQIRLHTTSREQTIRQQCSIVREELGPYVDIDIPSDNIAETINICSPSNICIMCF